MQTNDRCFTALDVVVKYYMGSQRRWLDRLLFTALRAAIYTYRPEAGKGGCHDKSKGAGDKEGNQMVSEIAGA